MSATDPANSSVALSKLYTNRFSDAEQRQKAKIWKVLCHDFFQRYVKPTDTVLDVGAGYCEFINNIVAAKKIALDLNEDTPRYAAPGVRVVQSHSNAMNDIESDSVNVAFASNFFEHMPTKEVFLQTLREIRRVLRPGGKLLILQPNIRYIPGEYWDFLDHHIALTDRTLVEALEAVGMQPVEVRPRFLPYTTKSRIPQHPLLVKLYLRVPLAQRLMGKQAWVVGQK
ncbi:MAG: class I SAM-dependent methyltransferase [Oscillochloris sp.]|nr:class I SAM-dependent methyltransferase [Oscillochloris sp.]